MTSLHSERFLLYDSLFFSLFWSSMFKKNISSRGKYHKIVIANFEGPLKETNSSL